MPINEVQKIWFDVKNLDSTTVGVIRGRLQEYDTRLGLKNRIIVESPTAPQLLGLSRDGFHTSYYLPTTMLLRLLEAGARDSLRNAARDIAGTAREAEVRAVSFDHRLYAFVKQYVEPLITRDVVYHTWNLDLSLTDPEFLQKLMHSDIFWDPRVETILVGYSSEFKL